MARYEIIENDNKVIQSELSIPIMRRTQVLVAGAGTAGFAAALAAARNGAETMIIEQSNCIGGMMTGGLMGVFVHTNIRSGVFWEVIQKLEARGAAKAGIPPDNYSAFIPFDSEELKTLTLEMLLEAGVNILLDSWIADTIVSDGVVKGVVVENISGRQAFLADVIVDCTGDADVAVKAGVKYELGRKKDGKVQFATLLFRVGNVDIDRLVQEALTEPNQFKGGEDFFRRLDKDIFSIQGFFDKLRDAAQRGEVNPNIYMLNLKFSPDIFERRTLVVEATKVAGYNPTIAEELTQIEIEARMQVAQLMKFMQKQIPGFEKAYLINTGSQIGIRDSRRIVGEYTLTEDDILEGKVPDDSIVIFWGHGPDIKGWARYDIDNPELYLKERQGITWHPTISGIPYRCFIPRNISQLLVAGRCLSATREAQGRSSAMITCMKMGYSIGTAAALAATNKISPNKLDIKVLREKLISQDALETQALKQIK